MYARGKFLPHDAMHSTDYAVARFVCPSVCLSHAGILSKRITKLFFHLGIATQLQLFCSI